MRAVAAWLCLLPLVAAAEDKKPTPTELVGEPAPMFILRTLNPEVAGPRYVLRDHVGPAARTPKKKVLLDFAASWCVPCRKELAELAKLEGALDAAQVGVAVVVIDDTPEGIAAMEELIVNTLKTPFPAASDRFQVLARRYRVGTLPLAVVLDEAGVIRHVQEGYTPEAFAQLRAALGV